MNEQNKRKDKIIKRLISSTNQPNLSESIIDFLNLDYEFGRAVDDDDDYDDLLFCLKAKLKELQSIYSLLPELFKGIEIKPKPSVDSHLNNTITRTGSLSSSEKWISDAIASYYAVHASHNPRVIKFREECLNRRILTRDEAEELLISNSKSIYIKEKKGLYNCEYYANGEKHLYDYEYYASVEMPKESFGPNGVYSLDDIYLRNESESRPEFINNNRDEMIHHGTADDAERHIHSFTERDEGNMITLDLYYDSKLLDIIEVATDLAIEYRWDKPDAIWFLLTNKVPPIQALSITTNASDEDKLCNPIKIEAAPWITAKTVQDNYICELKKMDRKKNQQPGFRSMKLFKFVSEQILKYGERPTWESMFKQWNASCDSFEKPKGHKRTRSNNLRFTDINQMRNEYQRAKNIISRHGFTLNISTWTPVLREVD
ncbi:MAG: hypothetical protein ACYC27_00810 [Armatimonadota bacterium]